MIQRGEKVVKKHADVIKPLAKPVMELQRLKIPSPVKPVVMRELARSNMKFQQLDEKLDRYRGRMKGESTVSRETEVEKPTSPVKSPKPIASADRDQSASGNMTPVKAPGHQYNLCSRSRQA